MMTLAVAIAVGGSIGGLYLSYYAGLAAGASIALVLVGAYVSVFALGEVSKMRAATIGA